MRETDVLEKFAELAKEASEKGLRLKYGPSWDGQVFYLTRNNSVIYTGLNSLDNVETFLKGYQEGYRGCAEDYENYTAKDAGISGLYEHDFT